MRLQPHEAALWYSGIIRQWECWNHKGERVAFGPDRAAVIRAAQQAGYTVVEVE